MPRESSTQLLVISYLRRHGFRCERRGLEGEPDYEISNSFEAPRRRAWIEFKQDGASFTKAQKRRLPSMVKAKEAVFIVTELSNIDFLRASILECLADTNKPVPAQFDYASHA